MLIFKRGTSLSSSPTLRLNCSKTDTSLDLNHCTMKLFGAFPDDKKHLSWSPLSYPQDFVIYFPYNLQQEMKK